MKKRLLIFVSIFMIIVIGGGFVCIFSSHKNPSEGKQKDLANQLGIKITDYPYPKAFPEGYFYTVLKPGMTVDEVHHVVQDYEKVYRCRSSADTRFYSEIYYYFSVKDQGALRFEVFYDQKEKFEKLQGEDNNSSTIRTDDCEIGLIGK
jgi:hypothetical protein